MACPHKHPEEEALATAVKATPVIWRTLDERQQTAEFEKHLHREFAPGSSEWLDPVSRRNFLKIMGASVALAGAAGCIKYPDEAIVPYVQPPNDEIPGRPMYYATAMPFDGHAWPMIATANEGRPTKVDGNPDHPASMGSSTAIGQASILQLYDPERAQTVSYAAQTSDWSTFQIEISKEMAKFKANGGTGLRFLSTSISSPTLAKQMADFSKMYPNAKWHVWEACANHGARQASIAAFGKAVNTVYHFEKASRILSLDSNFCADEQGSLIYARQFINGRRLRRPDKTGPVVREIVENDWQNPKYVESGNATMNRLYMVETNYSSTGAMADHRLALKPSQIEDFARAVAAGLGVAGVTAPAGIDPKFLKTVLDDLRQAGASALVIPGRNQPASVHVLAHAINQQLGAVGNTVVYTDPIDANPIDHVDSIRQLAADMAAGHVEALIIMDGNPVYDAPADLNFVELLNSKVRLRIRFGLYYDETSFYCHWHLPASHYLESWSDARGFEGTICTIQPLILPLYQTKSAHELLALLSGNFTSTDQEIIHNSWRSNSSNGNISEDQWETALCKGVGLGAKAAAIDVTFNADALNAPQSQASKNRALEVSLPPDLAIWDGTWSTNGWLQELPRPITKLVWDNAALISPATAQRLGVQSESLIQLNYLDHENKEQGMTVAVWVVPGHADDCITLNLGYGRKNVTAIGGVEPMENLGFNAYPLRKTENLNFTTVTATPAKGRYPLSSTQLHQNPEGRDLVRFYSGAEFATAKAEYPEQEGSVPGVGDPNKVRLSLYPEFDYSHGHRWGMVVDDNACVGCNACVMACQAENNIPVVGKDQVARYREMHWLRIDSWHFGDESNPITVFEPVMCQMCEHAPCEEVCPVNATTHSAEGINEMTYNRCVGTRYCSNNCPYKVRRFNFLRYNDYYTPSLKMVHNPLVSVRERGVMEKCTYCIQRLDLTRIDVKRAQVAHDTSNDPDEKKRQAQTIVDLMMGLQTACQQACPTEALVFGDMNYQRPDHKPVRINELKKQQQSFGLLTEYNTQPRTSYMNRFRNPNPVLEPTPLEYPTQAEVDG